MQPHEGIHLAANAVSSGGFQYNYPMGGVEMNGGGRGAPPVPPRTYQSSQSYGVTSPYTSPYGGYPSYPSYGGYNSSYMSGVYSGYGNQYGQRYGGAVGGYEPENGFIAAAEESSQAAFQSIESVVRAFSSISMMLDSTLGAVYSSFRAVLGVAENFTRMKNNFSAVLSALAIMKTVKWALKKLLYLIGIEEENPSREAWRAAFAQAAGGPVLTETDIKKTKSSWPILMFFAIISAAPYLIWRILKSLTVDEEKDDKQWAKGQTEHYLAAADYDFMPATDKELSFKAGQQLRLAPKELQPRVRGWLLGSADGVKTGLVPANYIRILGKRPAKASVTPHNGGLAPPPQVAGYSSAVNYLAGSDNVASVSRQQRPRSSSAANIGGSVPVAGGSVPVACGSLPVVGGSVPVVGGSVPVAGVSGLEAKQELIAV